MKVNGKKQKKSSDFKLVKKNLEELINLTKEESVILGEVFKLSPYEALVNKFEPFSNLDQISNILRLRTSII